MALELQTVVLGSALQRLTLGEGRTRVPARPGSEFKIVDDAGKVIPGTSVKRVDNNLVVEGLPGGRSVEITDFFTACAPSGASSCSLSMAELGSTAGPITPASDPIAALPDGSFLLYGGANPGAPAALSAPIIAAADNSWKAIGAGIGGLAIAGLAVGAGGGGGGGGSTQDTTAPPPPAFTSKSALNGLAPTFTGTAEAGARVLVRIDVNQNGNAGDAGDVTFETIALADGTWRISTGDQAPVQGSWSGRLVDGQSYAVSAIARDIAGNLSTATNTTVAIDATAPTPPAVVVDKLINLAESLAGVAVSGTGEAGATVTVVWAGGATKTGTVAANGTWSLLFGTTELPQAQGASVISTTLTDEAGNVSSTVLTAVQIDTLAPAAPTVTSGAVTADARPVITGTAEPLAKVRLSLDLARNGSVDAVFDTTANAQGSWSVNTANAPTTGSMGAGLVNLQPNSLTVVATDEAGNPGAGRDASVVRDIVGTPATLSIALASDTGSSASDGVTKTGVVNVSGLVAGYTWQYSVDGSANWLQGTGNSFSVSADGTYPALARQRNLSGVDSSPSPALNITIDNASPLGPVVTDSVAGPTANGPVTFTFTFAEPVAGFTAADVNVTGGTAGAFAATSSSVYTLVVTPTPDVAGSISVSVPAGPGVTDLAGNALASAGSGTQAFNTVVQPTLAITDDTAGTATGPVLFTFTFSEPVTQFTAADIVVSGGATVGTFTALSQTVYTALITPPGGSGTFTVDVPASAALDLAGNPSIAAAQVSQPYAPADTTPPTLTSITDNTSGTANSTSGPITYTFNWSEPVTGFDSSDITRTGAGTGTFGTLTGSGATYTLTYTPAANSTDTLVLSVPSVGGIADLTGNAYAGGATNNSQAYDTQAASLASITDDTAGTATGPVLFTFTFSEPVTQFTAADIVVSGGATVGTFTALSQTVYTALITPPGGSGTFTVDVPASAALDLAGNPSIAAAQVSQPYAPADTTPPTLTPITDNTSGTANSTSGPITYTFNWSEPVTGFDSSDITRTGAGTGTFGTLTGSGATYTLTYTPAANSTDTLVLSVPSVGGIADLTGNAYAGGATNNSQAYDTQAPTQSGDAAANLAGATPQIIVNLDAVLGTDSVSMVRTGGAGGTVTLAAPAVTGGGTTLTFTEASALASATYTYTATITDTAGNSIQLDLDALTAGRNPLVVTI